MIDVKSFIQAKTLVINNFSKYLIKISIKRTRYIYKKYSRRKANSRIK